MRFNLDWLRDFVELPTNDPAEIADALDNLGLEVEEWGLIEHRFEGVVVGRVLEVSPHPDADKVRVTSVDVGDGDPLAIICGAWNFEEGAVVPVAVPGAVLQGDFEIGSRTIRGVVSNGMICSEAELEIGEDAAGIMVLDLDYPGAAGRIGEDFHGVLPRGDAWYDLKVTPDRPDAMSIYGLAVDLAARFEVAVSPPDITVTEVGSPGATSVTIFDEVACPRFAGREVRNIRIGASPHWMRYRLEHAGVRAISNVVDASNYAMIEFGHPTHAFDLDRLGETIIVRHATEGERILSLDGVERDLIPDDIVVADADRPVAIAGVMGGAETEVHEESTRVLVEAAYWHPPSILLTSKRLGLRSEASARFERGMDPNFCADAADRVAQLLEQIADGEVAPGIADEYPTAIEPRSISLAISEVTRVLGVELERDLVADLLGRLQLEVGPGDPMEVTVPTRRPDLVRPVDLIEEVARLHGFAKIPNRVRTGLGGGLPIREQRLRKLRQVMNGAGYHETLNFSFHSDDEIEAAGLTQEMAERGTVRIVNPLSEEEATLRLTLLPGLLESAAVNLSRRVPGARLYEIGKVFLPGTGKLPEQPDRLGFVAAGFGEDIYDATGLWDLIAHEMRLPDPGVTAGSAVGYHPGRCAFPTVSGDVVGVVGEVHPQVAKLFGLADRVVAGEIDLADLLTDRGLWRFDPPSAFPPVLFDLAFAVDEEVTVASLLGAVDAAGGALLEDRTVFDVYRGGSVGEGKKSIALRLTLRAPDRTLSDVEVAPLRQEIVEAVVVATGGELRGES